LPGLASMTAYERPWLRGDLVAGITVAAYLIPQVMAYAEVAGLQPVVGLWAIMGSMAVYAFFGSSRQLSVGPESTTALMTATAVAPLALGDAGRYAGLAAILALMVGVMCLVGYVARLGFLAELLSKPVLVGYMAGVAVIMTAAETLMKDPQHKHGPVRVVFTVDEEVGRGTDKVDIAKIGATAAYTLDGEAAAGIENETFSADMATVTITGVNIHPGFAKGRMVNALRLAGQFLTRLPWHRLAPETTEKREPFLHPYVIEGGVPEAKIRILLRSFETAELAELAKVLQTIAATLEAEHPRAKINVEVKKQYRNMREHLEKEPRAVKLAVEAYRRIGVEPLYQSIRGGTDGSRLSEMGLPTPNLSCGMHNFHSPLEFACLEEMETAVKALVELARLWGEQK